MTDEELGMLMRQLPRATASPRFASDVMRAVRARRPQMAWRFAAVTAMVLIIIAGTYTAALRQRQHRLEALRAERQRIETELQRVKAIADHAQPVVVLESGDTHLIVNKDNPRERPLFYY